MAFEAAIAGNSNGAFATALGGSGPDTIDEDQLGGQIADQPEASSSKPKPKRSPSKNIAGNPVGKREVPEFFQMLRNHKDFESVSKQLAQPLREQIQKKRGQAVDTEKSPEQSGGTIDFAKPVTDLSSKELKDEYRLCKGEIRAGNNNNEVKQRLLAIVKRLRSRGLISEGRSGKWEQDLSM